MDSQYREYCIFDVLDLPEVHDKMIADLTPWQFQMATWVSAHYVGYGYHHSNHN
jgi:hypothetical protein